MSKNAYAIGLEAGYDMLTLLSRNEERGARKGEHLYLFGRYEQYDPYASETKGISYGYTAVKRMAVGVNYYPMRQIVMKAEFSKRFLKSVYNDEPALNFCVAYEGFFL